MNVTDLSKQPPRSPHSRIHDYVILARTIDKCRADLNGVLGEYHFNCPLDNMLFEFKGITAEAFKEEVKSGASDAEIGEWLDKNGHVQTPGSISEWSKKLEGYRPYENPEKKSWFIEQCSPLGLNPSSSTLFDFLEEDDQKSFPGFVQKSSDPNNWDLPLVDTAPGDTKSSLKATVHQ